MALAPAGSVTVTSTVAAGSAGLTAVIEVGELIVNSTAGLEPTLTSLAPVNSVPAIFTGVPPAAGPALGEIPVTTGDTSTCAVMYAERSAGITPVGPLGEPRKTSTVADPAGDVAE